MTRVVRFSNNAVSKLASPITASSTTITLHSGDGAKFPAISGNQYFMATLVKADGATEVVKVTARASDTLTVVRAVEPVAGVQTAYAFSADDRIEHRLTAGVVASELDRLDQAAYISVLNVSSNYTVTQADITSLIRVDTTAGNVTITLPDISALTDDFDVIVSKVSADANSVTIQRSGAGLINGATSYPLTNRWQSAWITADRATNTWNVISSGGSANRVSNEFAGNGTAGPYTLTGTPPSKDATDVYVGGVSQDPSTWSLSGPSLTLGLAVSSAVKIVVKWTESLGIGVPGDGTVTTAKLAPGVLASVDLAPATTFSAIYFDTTANPAEVIYESNGTTVAANVFHAAGPTKNVFIQATATTKEFVVSGRINAISGSASVDSIYLADDGGYIDCRNLLGGEDNIFFPRPFGDYTVSNTEVSGAITIKRTHASGLVGGAVVLNGSTTTGKDWLIFANGRIRTDALNTAINTSTTPVLDGSVTTPATPPATAKRIEGFPLTILSANGQAVSRTAYATLFAKLSTRFGAGDGTTTFNLPNVPAPVAGVNAYISTT